jgi:hypothetical protein
MSGAISPRPLYVFMASIRITLILLCRFVRKFHWLISDSLAKETEYLLCNNKLYARFFPGTPS